MQKSVAILEWQQFGMRHVMVLSVVVSPHSAIPCKGVLLIEIRCNEVTNFPIPSAGN